MTVCLHICVGMVVMNQPPVKTALPHIKDLLFSELNVNWNRLDSLRYDN